jgi:hypothetical protein
LFISIAIGLLLTYPFSSPEIQQLIANYFKPYLELILNIQANPAFLSDIAAIEAAIIAFLVPLSIEIISKISERYNSDVITRAFTRKWENRILTPFLLVNIFIAVTLRLFIKDDSNAIWWTFTSLIVLVLFMFVAFLIWKVINNIKTFMSDVKWVLNQLYEDIEKSIQK